MNLDVCCIAALQQLSGQDDLRTRQDCEAWWKRLDKKAAAAYVHRSVAHIDKKNYWQAITDSSKAIELEPKNSWAYTQRGTAYAFLNDNKEALANLDTAITLDPNNVVALETRAWHYERVGEHDKAKSDREQAKQLRAKLKV